MDPITVNRLDNTTMPKKSIQGTPWYQILSNMQYADDFYYIGAFVEEREKLIKDGDMKEGNDCEQSDIVMILLNLSCVPDEIAQRFDFKAGFQEEFLQNMKKFQQAFQRTHGVKWGFMDDSLINRYLTFKRSKQALVDNLNRLKMDKNI